MKNSKCLLVVLVIFSVALFAHSAEASLKDNLIAYWQLDETSGTVAADTSGSTYDHYGTLTNMTGNEWTTGIVGGALEFDGTNDYVRGAAGGGLTQEGYFFGAGADFTIAFWQIWIQTEIVRKHGFTRTVDIA